MGMLLKCTGITESPDQNRDDIAGSVRYGSQSTDGSGGTRIEKTARAGNNDPIAELNGVTPRKRNVAVSFRIDLPSHDPDEQIAIRGLNDGDPFAFKSPPSAPGSNSTSP
ncbi:MAG: hypothetical protein NTX45_02520 [Proteobacteria bacterium]|nr:hypothetical protein [Pseudomonadota bacterium]